MGYQPLKKVWSPLNAPTIIALSGAPSVANCTEHPDRQHHMPPRVPSKSFHGQPTIKEVWSQRRSLLHQHC
jgi:hypothetical protein